MEFHDAANIFPMLEGDEYRRLRDDIAQNGLIEPIWLYDGKILDGRNRYTACLDIGITPRYREYTGTDPIGFVVSLNLSRRHLTSSQRAVIALEVERQLAEEARKRMLATQNNDAGRAASQRIEQQEYGKASEQAARMVGTNRQYVSDAKNIAEKAPDLLDKIRSGEMTIPQANREIVKQERSEAPELPTDKYRIVYADPPWKYGDKLVDGYGTAENHYPSMDITELCNLPINTIVDDNAVLFLWATSPFLEDSFNIIRAWGFKYKTSFVWDKVKHNFGHYNSVRHEFLLVCTRGSCTPDVSQLFDSVQSIERSDKHSEKPEEFRSIIDTLYTTGKRIELFARTKVDGWEFWGNEPCATSA